MKIMLKLLHPLLPSTHLLLATLLLILPATAGAARTPLNGKHLLVLHSYHQGFHWTDQQMAGILEVLHDVDPGYEPLVEYLDWKRFPDPNRLPGFRAYLAGKYAGVTIDGVIVTDNKALEFALANRAELFPNAPIAFCGINDFRPALLAGRQRVSGVVESVDPAGTIDLITTLLPQTRELVVLLDDTESSAGVRTAIDQALADLPKLTVRYITSPDREELEAAVAALRPGSVLLLGPYLRDRSGHSFSYEEVLARILPVSQVPVFSFWEFLIGRGITGGSLVSGELQGRDAARIALRLMSGETRVPVMTRSPLRVMTDYRQLQRFGLEQRQLPAGVGIINHPPPFVRVRLRTILAVLATGAGLVAIILILVIAIRQRRRAERSLRQSEERYRLLMESVPIGITLIDRDFRIRMVNRAQAQMLQRPPEWFRGRHCHEAFEQRDQVCPHCPGAASMASGSIAQVETEGLRPDGSRFSVLLRTVPVLGDDGAPQGFIEVVEDITERNRAEQERLKLEQQIQHTQKLESLGVLAGGIAHDFNNILTAISGHTELAVRRLPADSPARNHLHQVGQSTLHAAELARQMLAYSGKGTFVVEPLDLNRLLEEILSMLKVSISKKVELNLDLAPELPAVEADGTQLRQVVMNLVINASEALGEKSGSIVVTSGCRNFTSDELEPVCLGDQLAEGRYVYLEVADNGCGMAPEVQARLFEPFFTTKFTGRGLGMAALLGIVRSHHGGIRVASEPGRGSRFTVLLPASAAAPSELSPPGEQTSWQGMGTVLLVDDEELVRTIGSEMLSELGFAPLTAGDGGEALKLFREHRGIEYVILDLTMPRMDGEQCFRELRQADPEVKVILSSGFDQHDLSARFAKQNVAGFLQKPYQLADLKAVIGSC